MLKWPIHSSRTSAPPVFPRTGGHSSNRTC